MTRPELRATDTQNATRQADAHRAIDVIFAHYPAIVFEANTRGYPHGPGNGGGDPELGDYDRTVAAALNPDRWQEWVARIRPLLIELNFTADMALRLNTTTPTPKPGRGNSLELCVKCGQPIPDKIHRVDGQPLCATSCYSQLWRQGLREGTTIGALVAGIVKTGKKGGT